MKELDFLRTINETLSKKSHIGDDCAYLKDIGIVVTQDSLVEDVHFSRKYSTIKDIAYKSIMVNLSDVFASGAKAKYITIALSLPTKIEKNFIKEFYETVNELSKKYKFEIIGGDITGAEKIMISICAIGKIESRNISSRASARAGDLVIASGEFGTSAAGLWALQNNKLEFKKSIDNHLRPKPQKKFSEDISKKIKRYAMMDSSDGLIDAVFKIANASKVKIILREEKIPFNKEIKQIAKIADVDYRNWIFYGGEDFQLIATLSEKDLSKLNCKYKVIGHVEKCEKNYPPIEIRNKKETYKITNLEKSYNHFKEI